MKTFRAIPLKKFSVIGTMAAFFLVGGTVVTFAQEEHHEEPAKPAEHQEAAKPPAHEEAAKITRTLWEDRENKARQR